MLHELATNDLTMAFMLFSILLCFLITCFPTVRGENCPRLAEKGNQSLPYILSVRGNNSTVKSEFLCDFIFTDEQHMKQKLLDRLTNRQKRFVRFTVPVLGFNNPYLHMTNYSGYLTWVWVLDSHEYMLYYPHNFITISAKTMGIITQDWAIDYSMDRSVSLEQFGLDPDDFDTHDIVGYCDPECVRVNRSCGFGKYELETFLVDVTKGKDEFKWNWLCLQSPYDVQDIVSVPNFAFPDLLYYWRFLRMLYTRRPWFGTMQAKTDLPQYYCYNAKDSCELKELLMHFWLIPMIGIFLWLYSPLLVHYFPSSSPKKRTEVPKDMFPSYKTPIYFGRCLKSIFCFYMQKGLPTTKIWVRIRRTLFLIALAATSFRLFFLYPYYYYSWPMFIISLIATSVPTYLSEHITTEIPSQFLLFWKLPPSLVRANRKLIEYQQLAHVLQERFYLTVDIKFWKFVFMRSFDLFFSMANWSPRNTCIFLFLVVVLRPLALLVSLVIFVAACLTNILFYFIPLPYFYVMLLRAIFAGEYKYVIQTVKEPSSLLRVGITVALTCCHSIVMIGLLIYMLVVTYIWCYAISEFTMFTFIGGALTASMAFNYFVLIGSVVTAIYTLVRDLHEGYDRILEETIKILKEKEIFKKLKLDVYAESGDKLILKEQESESDYSITIGVDGEALPHCKLLIDDGITTYINKDLYDDIIERCRPLRRQVAFIIFKIIAILFYCGIAFWVKNVYHLEDQVGGIFQMVSTVAVYFLPSMLQFISYKSHFGKKTDIVLRQEIYRSLVTYLSEIHQ